ncbi:MAG: fluoride efflux transporter CrcB [Hyphomicrobiaceae bacterium]
MKLMLLAGMGGAIGASARYLVGVACAVWFPVSFPWATFAVNVIGSFLMGIIVAAWMPLFGGSPAVRVFLATGFLGGFTTFSAFALDIFELSEQQGLLSLVFYVAGSVALSVLALGLGLLLVRTVLE